MRGEGVGFRSVVKGSACLGFMLLVAGCQSGDTASVLQPSPSDAQAAQQQEMVRESDLRGYCPRVTLRSGEAVLDSYDKGGEGDAKKLRYQASVSEVTRDCRRSNGMLSITVALAGRVVPGPAFGGGQVTLPVKIVMQQGANTIQSGVQPYAVNVSDTSTATQFVFTGQPVTIPEPSQRDIQIFAGFDLPPPKKPANDAF